MTPNDCDCGGFCDLCLEALLDIGEDDTFVMSDSEAEKFLDNSES